MTDLQDILSQLDNVSGAGEGYKASCPAHDDKTPSLSITEKSDKVLFHCHAGCSQQAVMAALNMTAAPSYQEHRQSA